MIYKTACSPSKTWPPHHILVSLAKKMWHWKSKRSSNLISAAMIFRQKIKISMPKSARYFICFMAQRQPNLSLWWQHALTWLPLQIGTFFRSVSLKIIHTATSFLDIITQLYVLDKGGFSEMLDEIFFYHPKCSLGVDKFLPDWY